MGGGRTVPGAGGADPRLIEAKRLVLMGQIGADVSHDLNNVLGKIIGLAEMTQDQLADRPEARAELETLIDVAEQGARLVGRLAACAGRDIAEPRRFDLAAMAADASAVVAARRPGLHLQRDLTAGPCPVVADAALVRVALDAVLDNAARWAAGRVAISCRTAPEVGTAEVSVQDDGPGMASEVLARAFEPFFTTRPAGEAPGLGLSLAQSAMAACGGRVEAESAAGEGTTVRLILPPAAAGSDEGGR